MTSRASATEALRTSGYRLTLQRQFVWDTLRQATEHLSAEQICSRIRRRFPRFNLATTYRSLEVMAELGLLQQTRIDGRGYYALAQDGQDHYPLLYDQRGSTGGNER